MDWYGGLFHGSHVPIFWRYNVLQSIATNWFSACFQESIIFFFGQDSGPAWVACLCATLIFDFWLDSDLLSVELGNVHDAEGIQFDLLDFSIQGDQRWNHDSRSSLTTAGNW